MYLPNITLQLWEPCFGSLSIPCVRYFHACFEGDGLYGNCRDGTFGKYAYSKACYHHVWYLGVIGYYFVIIFSAMTNVPQDYYDAAAIDGAGAVRKFFSITLPLIKGTIQTLFILAVAQLFSSGFIGILVMTGGGPNRSSEVLSLYMYQQSFGMNNFGYGAAVGTVMLIISIVLYNLATRLVERGDENEG